jgi:hypothetical protein
MKYSQYALRCVAPDLTLAHHPCMVPVEILSPYQLIDGFLSLLFIATCIGFYESFYANLHNLFMHAVTCLLTRIICTTNPS